MSGEAESDCLYSRMHVQTDLIINRLKETWSLTVLLVPWWLTLAITSQEQHLLLVLLLLSVCKSLQRSLILCAPQGVSLESGCKSTAFQRTHQIFSEKNARKIRFLTNNWFRSSIWRENKRKKGQKEVRKGVMDIPAMYIFKMLIGLNGVTWATPFAEVTSAVTAVILYMEFRKILDWFWPSGKPYKEQPIKELIRKLPLLYRIHSVCR